MRFCHADGLVVEITDQIIDKMTSVCKKYYPYECGGILIGFYSEDCTTAFITDITSQGGK